MPFANDISTGYDPIIKELAWNFYPRNVNKKLKLISNRFIFLYLRVSDVFIFNVYLNSKKPSFFSLVTCTSYIREWCVSFFLIQFVNNWYFAA